MTSTSYPRASAKLGLQAQSRRRRKMRLLPWMRQLIALVVGIALWEVLGRIGISILVPTASGTAAAWWALMELGVLLPAVAESLQGFAIGWVAALLVGLPLGLVLGRYRSVRLTLDLLVYALMVTPIIVLIPLLILWTGTGLSARAVVVFLFTFIPLVINTEAGVHATDSALLEMARSFGANERQRFMRIIIPSALPLVLAGLRLSVGRATKGMVTSEVLLAAAGLGRLLLLYGKALSAEYIYAITITIVAMAMLLNEIVRYVERRALVWQGDIQV